MTNIYELCSSPKDEYRAICEHDVEIEGGLLWHEIARFPNKHAAFVKSRKFYFCRNMDKPAADLVPFLPDEPILSSKAAEVLGPTLRQFGELFPIEITNKGSDSSEYYFYVCNHVVDAIDEKRSVWRCPNKPNWWIHGLKEYHFREEVIRDEILFRIPRSGFINPEANPGEVYYPTFVTDRFVDLVRDANLVGFHFVQHYSS